MHTSESDVACTHVANQSKPETTLTGWNFARQHRSARSVLENKPTVVYRHYAENGDLLYVGVSSRPGARHASHEKESAWYMQVASTTYQRYSTRSEAEAEEARVIVVCRPQYNLNSGIRKQTWKQAGAVATPSVVTTRDATCTTVAPAFLLPRERVLATLQAADQPLSFEGVRKLTSGKTQSIRGAIDAIINSGEAVVEKRSSGHRLVLADRVHLLRESSVVSRKHSIGTMRERVITTVTKAAEPLSFSAVIRHTCGKSKTIIKQIEALLVEGVLVETAGPRNARLVSLALLD